MFPRTHLHGVERRAPDPQFTFESWLDGRYQERRDRYFRERVGFRSLLIKTYNQINFSLFGIVAKTKGTQVIVGKDNYLYEAVYVNAYNTPGSTPETALRGCVRDLRALQDKLAARNIGFLLVIAPSKVEIYPEYVPDDMLVPGRSARRTEYDRIVPLIEEFGVHCLDAHRLFLEEKNTGQHALFSRGGVHWNYYGAAIVLSRIISEIELQTGRDFISITRTGVMVDYTPRGTDNDLGELLNIWQTRRMIGPQVHPVLKNQAGGDGQPMNLLFIGDSFVHTLTEILTEQQICERWDMLFYYRRRFTPAGRSDDALDRSELDWKSELLARDAVLLEINEYWLTRLGGRHVPDLGFGFVKDALSALTSKHQ